MELGGSLAFPSDGWFMESGSAGFTHKRIDFEFERESREDLGGSDGIIDALGVDCRVVLTIVEVRSFFDNSKSVLEQTLEE